MAARNRNMGPHRLDLDSLISETYEALIGAGTGKRLVMRVMPLDNTLVYVVTTSAGQSEHSTLASAIETYNADCWG